MCEKCERSLDRLIAANERHRKLVTRLHGEDI